MRSPLSKRDGNRLSVRLPQPKSRKAFPDRHLTLALGYLARTTSARHMLPSLGSLVGAEPDLRAEMNGILLALSVDLAPVEIRATDKSAGRRAKSVKQVEAQTLQRAGAAPASAGAHGADAHSVGRIAELDGLRAIAVLAVIAYHLAPAVVPGGFLGVDLFFVLSGYLITSLLLEEERRFGSVSLSAFYARRALRILPPLALAIALALALHVANGRAALAAALFYANFTFRGSLEGLAHTWSLAVEEHFYFLWPLAFLVLRRHRQQALMAVVALAIVVRVVGPLLEISPGWLYQVTPARADALAIGCLTALMKPPRRFGFFALAMVVASFFFVRLEYYGLLMIGMTVFAVACAAAINGARGAFLRNPVLGYVGRRSYGLYLYHWPIFMAVDELVAGDLTRIAMKVVFPLIATEASFWLVERQAMALKQRLGVSSDRSVFAVTESANAESR